MSKSSLQSIPKAPKGVKYALSVPQSVLFTELSLRGNCRSYFKQAMGIDYEPSYIIIDGDGAISWNYDNDLSFNKAVIDNGSIEQAVSMFIGNMARTSRKVNRRTSLGSPVNRRRENRSDLLEDLEEYWEAYKLHMTCLFVFWNIQNVLSTALINELKKLGKNYNINDLEKYIRPSETNQYLRERRVFERIVERFGDQKGKITPQTATLELVNALRHHSREFGFLLTPFNLGQPPTVESLLNRVMETKQSFTKMDQQAQNTELDLLDDISTSIKRLILLTRDLAFWKNERLDCLSIADAQMEDLYKAVAKCLKIEMVDLFAMTSIEIKKSIKKGKVVVSKNVLKRRQESFCLVLSKGKINFYKPFSPKSDKIKNAPKTIKGRGVSQGIIKGVVQIIRNPRDLLRLKTGNILVCSMTRPEMGSALERAAAFVTDEGGLLCHAAIIAREMGKPCVIATTNATKILRDGDLVEVDANNGIVKIFNL